MYLFELADIMFFIKSVKYPSDKFNILDYVEFNTIALTRSAKQKLRHKQANTNLIMNSYFYRLPRLWNSLPIIDLSCSLAVIKFKLKAYFWDYFVTNFDSNILCTYHYLCPCCKCSKTLAFINFNSL